MRFAAGTPPSILDAHGSEAHHLANVWWIMLGIAAFVYLVVGGFTHPREVERTPLPRLNPVQDRQDPGRLRVGEPPLCYPISVFIFNMLKDH